MTEKKQKTIPSNKAGVKTDGKMRASRAGVKKLRIAADKAIGLNSEKITASLMKQTLKGNVNSVKLLLSLAEPQPAQEKAGKRRGRRSAASELAGEPEWPGEPTEAGAEKDGGSREPEG
jgi:hypothetical protein